MKERFMRKEGESPILMIFVLLLAFLIATPIYIFLYRELEDFVDGAFTDSVEQLQDEQVRNTGSSAILGDSDGVNISIASYQDANSEIPLGLEKELMIKALNASVEYDEIVEDIPDIYWDAYEGNVKRLGVNTSIAIIDGGSYEVGTNTLLNDSSMGEVVKSVSGLNERTDKSVTDEVRFKLVRLYGNTIRYDFDTYLEVSNELVHYMTNKPYIGMSGKEELESMLLMAGAAQAMMVNTHPVDNAEAFDFYQNTSQFLTLQYLAYKEIDSTLSEKLVAMEADINNYLLSM